ncbi:hypothetical protein K8Z61_16665 [Nocardioides sp. TRM66260-LWL]|uniref:hypothetical protein n=1 Tax=Nocardioides sp. TRM66260-LWL TaxID=2874478 RepID=UPI001CC65EEB|nr:hypothetical protein [Nocardioides sp. TRM66260-LWL]MBZ5736127.1 hypothetical protein [Nocardioides sp. TRM66260-LWL]
MSGPTGPTGPTADAARSGRSPDRVVRPLAEGSRRRRPPRSADSDADRSLDALLLALGIPIGIALGLTALAAIVLAPALVAHWLS